MKNFRVKGCLLFLLLAHALTIEASPPAAERIRRYVADGSAAETSRQGQELLLRLADDLDALSQVLSRRYCGTGLLGDLVRRRQDFDPSTRTWLATELPGLMARPVLSHTFDAPLAPIRVHYDLTGLDSVRNATTDVAQDGIPVYVHEAVDALTRSYELLLDSLGYSRPLGDGAVGGGTDVIDCYLAIPPFASNVIAVTVPEVAISDPVTGVLTSPSYMIVHPTMEPFLEQLPNPLDLLRITCAHELFHTIHFSLDRYERPDWQRFGWWPEGVSVWFEDYAYPDVNDWSNLRFYFDAPQQSITQSISPTDLHPYGGGSVWAFYLTERFGGPDILRDIWTGCSLVPGDNTLAATAGLLQSSYGITLDSAWSEFASWCMRTGSRWDDSSFSQGADWPEARVAADEDLFKTTLTSYPSAVHFTNGFDGLNALLDPLMPTTTVTEPALQLQSLGFLPLTLIRRSTTSDTFRVFAESIDSLPVAFSFIGRNELVFPPRIDAGSLIAGDTTSIDSWQAYDSLLVVAAAGWHYASPPGNGAPGAITPLVVATLDTSLLSAEVTFQSPFPNPARLDQGDSVRFAMDLASRVDVRLDVFTLAGERVRSLEQRGAVGLTELVWDGRNDGNAPVASGLYLCRIRAGDVTEVLRVGVVR